MNVNVASSSPKHVRRRTLPDGQVTQKAVSVTPPLQLTDLHEDMLYQLCRYLPLHETNVLARSCQRLDQMIDKGFLSSEGRTWFARFGPEQQNQFRAIAKTNSDDDLRDWLTTPGKEQAIVEQLIRRRKRNDLFAEVLAYTSGRLTTEAAHFEAFSLLKVYYTRFTLGWMGFNPDGRFAVVMVRSIRESNCGALAMIYCACHSQQAKGGWAEQLAIPCQDSLRRSLAFSPDNEHMAVASVVNTIVIYRLEPVLSRSTDKLWRKLATIRQTDKIEQITFNANGHYLATLCANGVTTISALGREGEWLEEAVISLNCRVVSVTFADNGHRVLLGLQNKSGKIYDRSSSGNWVEHSGFEQCAPVFRGDGCHAIIYSNDGKTRICSRGADGTWSNGIVIDDQHHNEAVRFSPNNKHLLISQGNTIKIFGAESPEIWAEHAVFDLLALNIESATFSSDSRHVRIDYTGNGFHTMIISWEKSNAWSTTAVFYHAMRVIFSSDSRHLLVRGLKLEPRADETVSLDAPDEPVLLGRDYYNDRKWKVSLKMYSWQAGREWSERTVVFEPYADENVAKYYFNLSSDNRHLLINSTQAIQLWRLEPQTGEYRKTPTAAHGRAATFRKFTRSRTTPKVWL